MPMPLLAMIVQIHFYITPSWRASLSLFLLNSHHPPLLLHRPNAYHASTPLPAYVSILSRIYNSPLANNKVCPSTKPNYSINIGRPTFPNYASLTIASLASIPLPHSTSLHIVRITSSMHSLALSLSPPSNLSPPNLHNNYKTSPNPHPFVQPRPPHFLHANSAYPRLSA